MKAGLSVFVQFFRVGWSKRVVSHLFYPIKRHVHTTHEPPRVSVTVTVGVHVSFTHFSSHVYVFSLFAAHFMYRISASIFRFAFDRVFDEFADNDTVYKGLC